MDFGLVGAFGSKKTCIPLEEVQIKATVNGLFMEVVMTQYYKNTSGCDLEAVYIFPVPDTAAVSGFRAVIGDREVKGLVKEKKKALEEYNRAILDGDSAYLLEEHRPNVLQISVGRIMQGEEVELELSYIDALQCQDKEVRLSIPTVVAPKYIPGSSSGTRQGTGFAQPTDLVPDADFITPPVGEADYRVSFIIDITPGDVIGGFESPSHDITVLPLGGDRYQVHLTDEASFMDRDFVLSYRYVSDRTAGGLVYTDDKGRGYVSLMFIPELEPSDEPAGRDFIFLLDISGSMDGEKLDQAKSALNMCLRNLTHKDTFNLIAFESEFIVFSRVSLPFNDESLDRATRWIKSLRSMGGTEIFEPLKYALENAHEDGSTILLFTDGQVGNENQIIKHVSSHLGKSSIYTFGIDTSVNSYFINRLAEAGRGLPEFIYPGERIDDKVLRQFSRILSPAFPNVQVNWQGADVTDVVPASVDRVFDLEPVTVVAKLKGAIDKDILLTAKAPDDEVTLAVIRPEDIHPGSMILSKVWALKKLKQLEGCLAANGNRRRTAAIEKEIIELSTESGLLSPLTAYVAVYERESKASGLPETITVPVSLPHMWDEDFGANRVYGAGVMGSIVMDCLKIYNAAPVVEETMPPIEDHLVPFSARDLSSLSRGSDDKWWQAYDDITPDNIFRALCRSQKADGSFGYPESFRTTTLALVLYLLDGKAYGQYKRQMGKAADWLAGYLLEYNFADLLGGYSDLADAALLVMSVCIKRGLLKANVDRIKDLIAREAGCCPILAEAIRKAEQNTGDAFEGYLKSMSEESKDAKIRLKACKDENEALPHLVLIGVIKCLSF
ncbi:MAG TPA: VIT and VWA domain-containing protein [Candidatus Atribacteria bacterium]|nr:VIT and VWA domain-containing protein [Candidatus Atribacteria bacterium]